MQIADKKELQEAVLEAEKRFAIAKKEYDSALRYLLRMRKTLALKK